MSCQPNYQTTEFDSMKLPTHLQGLVAPVVVWRYIKELQRRITELETDLEVAQKVAAL